MFSYVASTRVERKEDLFIFRPFPRHLYTRGQTLGPEFVLQVCAKTRKLIWKQQDCNTCLAKRVLAAQSMSTNTIMKRRSGLRRNVEGIGSCA